MSRTYDLAVDNIGPLTTTFTGPSTCLQTTTLVGSEAYYVAAFWDDVSECYPSGTSTGYNFHTLPQYYSPGLCPQGWEPVTSAGADFPKTASNYDQWVILPETNVWLCCPSGFTYFGFSSTAFFYTNDCRTTLNRGQHMTNLRISGSSSVAATVTILTTVRVDANGIVIMWQSTDSAIVEWAKRATVAAAAAAASRSSTLSTLGPGFTIATESSSTTSKTDGKTSSASSSSTPTPSIVFTIGGDSSSKSGSESSSSSTSSSTTGLAASQQTAPGSGGGGLSTGAKAGIGVGVALGVIALLVLGFWLGRRRKHSSTGDAASGDKAVSSELATLSNAHEASGRQIHEMHDARRYELDDGSRYELPANTR